MKEGLDYITLILEINLVLILNNKNLSNLSLKFLYSENFKNSGHFDSNSGLRIKFKNSGKILII